MGLKNTSSTGSHSFDKEMVKDVKGMNLPSNSWSHARNAINNSKTGDVGKLGDEPSNYQCAIDPLTTLSQIPYEIIGTLHITNDLWLIFSTDSNGGNEIGIFDEHLCEYTELVRDTCLGFNRNYLIIGVCRATSTCTYKAYWDDGLNPSRFLEFCIDPISTNLYTNENSPIPWVPSNDCTTPPCYSCSNTDQLDCNRMRLAPYIKVPCIQVKKGVSGGTLLNGSYMVSVAYAIDGQRFGDWYNSNVQGIFEHQNSAGSIDVVIDNLDTTFNEILVAVTQIVNQQTVTRIAGTYSTHHGFMSFDMISHEWPALPTSDLPIMTPVADKSDAIYNVNNYLLRCGPTSKEDFNYQPLANQIVTKWVAVEFPTDYYVKGGNKTGYMRDEVYSFFIRWIYDTGDKSLSSYHIPGRPAGYISGESGAAGVSDAIQGDLYFFEQHNTAGVTTPLNPTTLPEGAISVIAEGLMGYWQSEEHYPDDKPQVWNSITNPLNPGFNTNISPWPYNHALNLLDLCGRNIRHHKFPENCMYLGNPGKPPNGAQYTINNGNLAILGVKFENIKPPIDNEGSIIPGIVGYEILRGSRNGNKTIIAKGIINNMRKYQVEGSTLQHYFQNYPYNDLHNDVFLSEQECFNHSDAQNYPFGTTAGYEMSADHFTFHSPETNFTNPYLSANELKIYGEVRGKVTGKFERSEKHPKEKLISDFAFVLAAIAGIGGAMMGMHGKNTYSTDGFKQNPTALGETPGFFNMPAPIPGGIASGMLTGQRYMSGIMQAASEGGGSLAEALGGFAQNHILSPTYFTQVVFENVAGQTTNGLAPPERRNNLEDTYWSRTPMPFRMIGSVAMFMQYYTRATDDVLELIRAIIKFRDYALRYHSHCFYDEFSCSQPGNRRRHINNQEYIGPQITDFFGARINNLYRSRTVALQTVGNVNPPLLEETTRIRISDLGLPTPIEDPTTLTFDNTYGGYTTSTPNPQRASSHYAALKQRMRNQYGQITGIKQVPASFCTFPAPVINNTIHSDIVFGGDIYLGRYTEKNTFFFFYDWLYGQPDGTQFNYPKYRTISWPTYWANFEDFETTDFTNSVGSYITGALGGIDVSQLFDFSLTNLLSLVTGLPINLLQQFNQAADPSQLQLPHSFAHLDSDDYQNFILNMQALDGIRLSIKNAWFYLFSSGVRDFYVESEINVAYRDYGDKEEEQFYNPYGGTTDTNSMFSTELIKVGNYYKYDQSLSYGKLFMNYSSWANSQRVDYDPYIAETCFVYYPKRTIYSLPSIDGQIRDSWRIFLPNNYKDFLSKVTAIKSINKSGALIFFPDRTPVQFMGVDQLQTTSGTKLTIGDGGLFSQPMQNVANADIPYEFGSCQNRMSIAHTPAGLFWINQNQGKIHIFNNTVANLSDMDLKWWFALYLPYNLTLDFPDFELIDNPVAGIGCQTVYDNENGLVYFTKKDYKLKPNLPDVIKYIGGGEFIVNDITRFQLTSATAKLYFDDASWTISYDPKIKSWISWHDWHPNLVMPGKNTFMTVVNNGIWVHNELCNSYCNFYGKDYPFELEYVISTAQSVNTVRSLEYIMEVYKYADNCYDRFHILDANFDEAIIHNTEQVSGLLKLHLSPKNLPWSKINYPQIHGTFIDVLYTKEEQKYRLNQFWDVTSDRGEYNTMAQRTIWNTAPNGYIRTLNPNNLDYNKDSFERKKFRHYTNSVFLRKLIPGAQKFIVVITNNKLLNSVR